MGDIITKDNIRDIKVWVTQDGQLHCHVLNVQIWVDMLWQRRTRKQEFQAL